MPVSFSDLRTIDLLTSDEAHATFEDLASDLPGLFRGLDLLIQSLEGPEFDPQGDMSDCPLRGTYNRLTAYELLKSARQTLLDYL